MKPERILQIQTLVDEKKWSRYDAFFQPKFSVLESINILLRNMNNKERDLVMCLLNEYLIIQEYGQFALKIAQDIGFNYNNKKLNLLPVRPVNSTKTKSGQNLIYDISTFKSYYNNTYVNFIDRPEDYKDNRKYLINVFVDDFIGSGSQFLTMIQDLECLGMVIPVDRVYCIVAQQDAIDRLSARGIEVTACIVRNKGLGAIDGSFASDVSAAYSVYDKIEARLSCPNEYRRGYAGSEALVSMKSTPNNTLPIFWYEGANKWHAPFLRP